MKRILLAIDGGETSESIARFGFQIGQQMNAEIGMVSVVDTNFLITDGGLTANEIAGITKDELVAQQKKLSDKFFGQQKVWAFVQAGVPYEIILKVAKEWNADLLVMGTHGRRGVAHLLLGSVAEKVLRHTTIPILVLPMP